MWKFGVYMVEVWYNLAVLPAWSATACSIYSYGPGQLYYKLLDQVRFLDILLILRAECMLMQEYEAKAREEILWELTVHTPLTTSVLFSTLHQLLQTENQEGLANDLTILCDKDVVGLLDCS